MHLYYDKMALYMERALFGVSVMSVFFGGFLCWLVRVSESTDLAGVYVSLLVDRVGNAKPGRKSRVASC